ncbi:MAG: hypothetical protein RL260_1725 [Pseudomonadota bacterium]|jgi:hypothetical protein
MSRDVHAEVLAYIRTMSPGALVTADSLLMFYRDGGDVCAQVKARMVGADAKLQAGMDTFIGLMRTAFPDAWRVSKSQVRTLRGILQAATDGESE